MFSTSELVLSGVSLEMLLAGHRVHVAGLPGVSCRTPGTPSLCPLTKNDSPLSGEKVAVDYGFPWDTNTGLLGRTS